MTQELNKTDSYSEAMAVMHKHRIKSILKAKPNGKKTENHGSLLTSFLF